MAKTDIIIHDEKDNVGVVVIEKITPNQDCACWIMENDKTVSINSLNEIDILYKNLKEIDMYRKKFEDDTKKINHLLDTQSQYTKKQIVDAMKSSTNFYLSYQGRNDISLQQNYASLIERLTEKIYPQFHKEKQKNASSQYIKIGFISSLFKKFSISYVNK